MEPQSNTADSSAPAASESDRRSQDVALLERYRDGDQLAFAALVREHQDIAYRYARRVCNDHDLARDAVQEGFLRVLRHHERFDGSYSFRAWLLHIVRNIAIDGLRRRKTQSAVPYEDHLRHTAAHRPGDRLEALENRQRIALILTELPDKYREILIMREMDGMPAEDIATVIGVAYGTTRWRLHKARTLFRAAWVSRFGADLP